MMQEYEKKLKQLRKALWGSYRIVAEEAGVTKGTVSKVLNGEMLADDTVEKVINKAVEVRDRMIAIQTQKVQSLASRI
jgi:transcriptional regulator with XRE-family HTH domain